MPVLFDTPLTVGDADPDAPAGQLTHARAQLQREDPERHFLILTIVYGWYDNGAFIPSSIVPTDRTDTCMVEGPDYDSLLPEGPRYQGTDPGDPIFMEVECPHCSQSIWIERLRPGVKRTIYEKLVELGYLPSGTVV